MSKYEPLWEFILRSGKDKFSLGFAEIEKILGFPIDHSFLNCKKELSAYGYTAGKISMKNGTVAFEKTEDEKMR